MSPDERRKAIVEAALPLLLEHGRATTTKQIAEAAGIAEGTIFRVFPSKEELFGAALEAAFDPEVFLADLETIDPDQSLGYKLLALTEKLQERFVEIFSLLTALGMQKPPDPQHGAKHHEWRERGMFFMESLLEPHRDQLRVPPAEVVRVVRLLTFSGSHPHISENRLMTPDEIVDIVLHGTLTKES